MNISYNWLKEYVDFDMSAQEVADALTSIGLEVGSVEEVQTIKGGLAGLVVGEVLTCEPHPNSDHLHVCFVAVGQDAPLQIVCGAPNVDAGQKVIVATLGTKLYNGDNCFVIKKSKIRGIESFGMICAEDEIGVGTDHAGIIVLPNETPVGLSAKDYYQVKDDYLIEVDITPNRADACSHYGVARDFYAWLVRNGHPTQLHKKDVSGFKVDNNDLDIEISVENPEACPRYCAVTLKDCEVKESPQWLQDKLRTIGLRPINNIVDITNYIMFAYGQPLHCFDADMIKGRKVVVKTMPEGTEFVTLDGATHRLSEHDLAICNVEEPMCIAGVFGGKGSGTYETTRNVLLESAYFNPTWIRKSARRHGLTTDASFRFERGIDPDGQLYALKCAALMVKELAGGTISMDIKDVEADNLQKHFDVDLKYDYIHQIVGEAIPVDVIKRIVTSLEMQILDETEAGIRLRVPAYRVDVTRPCDVVEDILRIYGYNNIAIPDLVKSSLNIKGKEDKSYKLVNQLSEQLASAGFREIMSNSLTKEAYYNQLQSYPSQRLVRILNPLSTDLNVMRETLLFGGLESIVRNVNRQNADLMFFEFGRCYYFDEEKKNDKVLSGYSEGDKMGLWITGRRVRGTWVHPDEKFNFFELKAHVYNLLRRLGISGRELKTVRGNADIFDNSLDLIDNQRRPCVKLGIVSRTLLKQFDLNQDVYYAELDLKLLLPIAMRTSVHFEEISKYPAVSRDLALLVDKSVTFQQIEEAAYAAEKHLLKHVELFDVYEGANLEAGKKSYAVNFVLQDAGKTMNDKQTDAVMHKIVTKLESTLGAKLR